MTKMLTKILAIALAAASTAAITPAYAQDDQSQDDGFVRLGLTRSKLVDKGVIKTDGVVNPDDDYETNATEGWTLTGGYFVKGPVALEASISSPTTTKNLPAGALAGVPNLGYDEFVHVTAGASVHPLRGKTFSPYVGGGVMWQITTKERDRLGQGLNVPNSYGPYLQAGADLMVTDGLSMFVDVKKAWYDTNATGVLPTSATTSSFVDAKAVLDPLVIQAGATIHFGSKKSAERANSGNGGNSPWTLRLGATQLNLRDGFELNLGGSDIPGAGISTTEQYTPSFEIGYKLTDHVSLNATLGLPPKVDIMGSGIIGPITPTRLMTATYGPSAFTVQYRPAKSGTFRPYFGAGFSYMVIFDVKDGLFENVHVNDDIAPALEAGTDVMLNNKFGFFVDVKKAWLRTKVTGTYMGSPAEAFAKLDPVVVSGGLTINF